ncbi:MAG: GTPase HflX [Anaerolineae bacterium]|nr:GTPase HflX [Anaerolineae bacterium]
MRSKAGAWPVDDSLDELALLARTAGVQVVGEFTQALDQPNATYFVGPGKVEEVRAFKSAVPYDVVIFDDDLSPSQQRNLERELRTRVIDRRSLILDIFAQHARTREGALQVELAQYEYMLPRLTRAWTHLSRQTRGGVGLRGPGETQLEVDRRRMRERLTQLRRELEDVRRHRALYRGRRRKSGIPIVAIVGYTNAGKSTLLNRISGSNVLAADQLFATLDPTTRRVRLPGGGEALLTDTVGFVQKLPPDLVAAFRATLEEITDADVILHVVDITHPHVERQVEVVDATLRELGVEDTPVVVGLNKVDLLPEEEARRARAESSDSIVAISALTGEGIDKLLATIAQVIARRGVEVRAVIPYERSNVLSAVHRCGNVHRQEHLAEGTLIVASVPLSLLGQLEPYLRDGQRATSVEAGSCSDTVRQRDRASP